MSKGCVSCWQVAKDAFEQNYTEQRIDGGEDAPPAPATPAAAEEE